MSSAVVLPKVSTSLTILYDERCALCRRAKDWLMTQHCLVPVELLAAGSEEARRRYKGLPWLGEELVVVDEHGSAWVGPSAFVASMWATARYRSWAFALARPGLAAYTESIFLWISKRRDRWGSWSKSDPECTWCEAEAPICDHGHAMDAGENFCRSCGAPRAKRLEFA